MLRIINRGKKGDMSNRQDPKLSNCRVEFLGKHSPGFIGARVKYVFGPMYDLLCSVSGKKI